jgi:hypothetical protein
MFFKTVCLPQQIQGTGVYAGLATAAQIKGHIVRFPVIDSLDNPLP